MNQPPHIPPPRHTPRYVLDTEHDATTVLCHLTNSGWHTHHGFTLPTTPHPRTHIILTGHVTDPTHTDQILHAATAGAGIVAIADPTNPLTHTLRTALAALGPLSQPPHPSPLPLTPEHNLLRRLAHGDTIATAAAAEYLSLRTANRRIAQVRHALHVTTTREAVTVFLRHHPHQT